MPRRVSVPAADQLFRPTEDHPDGSPGGAEDRGARAVHAVPDDEGADAAPAPASGTTREGVPAARRPSGRVRHDEKMTVYVTAQELVEIERTRLSLRAEHALAVDRGRLVREAVALVLAEYEAHGEQSALVRRLAE